MDYQSPTEATGDDDNVQTPGCLEDSQTLSSSLESISSTVDDTAGKPRDLNITLSEPAQKSETVSNATTGVAL